MDRRVDSRLDLRLPCYVAFPGRNTRRLVGVTENMSRNGMLVSWNRGAGGEALPRLGDELTAEIELPPSQRFGRRCMHCQVTVVRVDVEDRGPALVGFRVDHMQFRNSATGRFARGDLASMLSRSRRVM